ncbi:hypothetical protein HK405_007071 [Cladochytrium tenue]|nr:hypothetical protein HK405_007071 [Cladochytrium tenue]
MLDQLLAIPFVPRAIAYDLPLLDLLELSHTCVAARAAVARNLVGPLILRPLLELAREALAMRGQASNPEIWIDNDWWLSCAVIAIRGCIDLRHLFDIQYMDVEAAAVLHSIFPRLQPENCCRSDYGRLEELLLDAIVEFGGNADASTAAALELIVAGYFTHNGLYYASFFSHRFDSDSVFMAAVDAMFEVIQEKVAYGSDFELLNTVVEQQLLLRDVLLTYLGSLDGPLYFASLCDRDTLHVHLGYLKASQTEKLDNFSMAWRSEDFRVAFLNCVEKSNKSLVVLACLCLNRQELLRLNCLEAIVPILLDKMGIQAGVGKIMNQIAGDLSDSQLLQLLDVGLSVSQSHSWATTVDPDLLRVGLPALCMALCQRGLKRRVQPLVRSMQERLLHEDWKDHYDSNFKHQLRICVLECKENLTMPDITAAWRQYLDRFPFARDDEHEVFSGPVAALIRDGRVSLREVEDMLVESIEHAIATGKSGQREGTLRFTRRLKRALGYNNGGMFSVLGRRLMALVMAKIVEVFCPPDAVARLLSPQSGLLLDAQFDACLRDLWVEAVVQNGGIIVSDSSGTKLRRFLSPLSAAVVARLRRRLRMFVGMKGGIDNSEAFERVARQMLQKAGILE